MGEGQKASYSAAMAPTRNKRTVEDIVASAQEAQAAHAPRHKSIRKAPPGTAHERLLHMFKHIQGVKNMLRTSFRTLHEGLPEKTLKLKESIMHNLDESLKSMYHLELATEDTWDDLKQPKVYAALVRPEDVKLTGKKRKLSSASPPSSPGQSEESDVQGSPEKGGSRASERRQEYLELRKKGEDGYGKWQKAVQAAAEKLGMTPNYGCRKGSEMYMEARKFRAWGHF